MLLLIDYNMLLAISLMSGILRPHTRTCFNNAPRFQISRDLREQF